MLQEDCVDNSTHGQDQLVIGIMHDAARIYRMYRAHQVVFCKIGSHLALSAELISYAPALCNTRQPQSRWMGMQTP